MVRSMTAFARHAGEGDWGRAVWELRSVNHRYLDISLRLPDDLRSLESGVRERISKALDRGKVDCTLRYENATSQLSFEVNTALLDGLIGASNTVVAALENSQPINPLDVLRWPGVLATSSFDLDTLSQPLYSMLDRALSLLVTTREREGEKLAAMISSRCEQARKHTLHMRDRVPEIVAALSIKLKTRIAELEIEFDSGRLEQELSLQAQKLDVAEEVDRLETHIYEVERVLSQSEPIGRRLDFLMQELNREANTLASKSAHVDSTGAAIELKVLIEQMREQIQNVE